MLPDPALQGNGKKKKGGHTECFWGGVPEHEIEALARCLLPAIQAYFESEKGQREFVEWEAQHKD